MDHFLLFMFRVCHAFLSVHCSLAVTCCEISGLFALLCVMFFLFLSFSHIVSWVMYGIVRPDKRRWAVLS